MENELFVNPDAVRKETFEFNGKKYDFEFRTLSWDQDLRIQNDAISMLPDGMDIDMVEATYKKAIAVIVKAPFEVTKENLAKLDEQVGSWLETQLNTKSFRNKQ